MKGLIIDEPWIGLVLRGEKIWEMRKTACHHRGRIGLIRKGSGEVVGIADVVGSLSPLSSQFVYAEAEPQHRIPPNRQQQAFLDGWRTPWVLANARPLLRPVPYKHPSGAVIWVNLDSDIVMEIEAQAHVSAAQKTPDVEAKPNSVGLDSDQPRRRTSLLGRLFSWLQRVLAVDPPVRPRAEVEPCSLKRASATCRVVKVTGGNIRNNHIYLPLDFFPDDTESSRASVAAANDADAANQRRVNQRRATRMWISGFRPPTSPLSARGG